MNWTGGRLSRHSNAKRSLKDRQRQHFAKVQANLRNGPKKPSPLKFSFLGTIIESAGSIRYPSIGDSSRSREIIKSITSHRYSSNSPLFYPNNSSQHPYPLIESQVKVETGRQSTPERVDEDDLYSATPLPVQRKQKRSRDSLTERVVNESGQNQEKEPEHKRRRKILQQGDWVGVSVQRPLQLAFAPPNHVELVGRRRKVTDGHQARYKNRMQPLFRNTFATPDQARQGTRHWENSDVRISIGGRAIPPGIGSSSIRSGRREASARSYLFNESQGSSSDVMLLDNDDYTGKKMHGGSSVYYSARDSLVNDTHQSNHYARRSNLLHGDSAANERSDEHDSRSAVNSVSQSSGQTCIFERVRADPNSTGQPVVSSSTTSLQHPRPRSSRTSLLLRSDSAEIASSIVAHVGDGSTQATTHNSHGVDNEIWESWVGPVFEESQQQNFRSHRPSLQPAPICTGVSQASESYTYSDGQMETSGRNLSHRSGYGKSSIRNDSLRCSNQSHSVGNGATYGAELFPPIAGRRKISPLEPPVNNVQGGPRSKPIRQIEQHVKAHGGPDLDRIWRNFVFGNSYGDD